MSADVLRYPFELVKDGYGSVFVVFPDVPDAMTFAASEEEAITRASRSLRAALDDYAVRGNPIPAPAPAAGRAVIAVDRSEILNRGGS